MDYSLYTDPTGKFWGNAGAGCIFQAENTGRVLLTYRSEYVNEPHTWGVWGGKIDDGETPVQAVRREIFEEAGYRGEVELKPLYTYQKGDFKYYNYLAIIPEEFEPTLGWETEDFIWTDLNNLPSPLHFGLKALLPHFNKKSSFIPNKSLFLSAQKDSVKYMNYVNYFIETNNYALINRWFIFINNIRLEGLKENGVESYGFFVFKILSKWGIIDKVRDILDV